MFPKLSTAALLLSTFAAPSAFAQLPASPGNASQLHAFDVVSIRPSQSGNSMGHGPSTQPDGYSGTQVIAGILMFAYFPQSPYNWRGRIEGLPSWTLSDPYDIVAKVSEADRPEWARQADLKLEQNVLFQQMLQSMLADRFKLAFHRVPGSVTGYDLVPGKHPHLTASIPGAMLPAGMKLSDGGVMVDPPGKEADEYFYNTTMAAFLAYLPRLASGHPLADKTGLTGHYDFVLRWAGDSEHPGAIYPDAPDPLSNWDFNSIGLRAESVKIPGDILVIDHIEKPSDN